VKHSDTVTLAADTFDWYVPVPGAWLEPGGHSDALEDTLADLRAAGWAGKNGPTLSQAAADAVAKLDQDVSILRDGTQDWEGEQREAARPTCRSRTP
jgi:hypothetical protein